MKLHRLLMIAVVAVAAGCTLTAPRLSTPAAMPSRGLVRVDASLDSRSVGQLAVVITLTNTSDMSLAMFESDLPWGNVRSLSMVAMEANDSGMVLRQLPPLDLPVPTLLHIAPSQTLQGRVTLSNYFPDIASVNATTAVLVMWSYRLRLLNNEAQDLQFGIIYIPRDKLRSYLEIHLTNSEATCADIDKRRPTDGGNNPS
jgi:hypothetical protein